MPKAVPFKYDKQTAYIFRYSDCGNMYFYDSGGTSKEFFDLYEPIRKQVLTKPQIVSDIGPHSSSSTPIQNRTAMSRSRTLGR